MTLAKLWIIAFRDLKRSRRRTIFTLLAVGLGLALLMAMHGLVTGVIEDTLQNGIRLETGHVQLRAPSYDRAKLSLQWKDLLENADALAARAAKMPEVQAAAPVLWAGGALNTADQSAGVQVYGVSPDAQIYTPIRESIVAGAFLSADERDGILIGKSLADSLGLGVGDKANLVIIDGDGKPAEATFAVRGLFVSDVPVYNDSSVFMGLDKLQAFTNSAGRASAVVILLRDQDQTDKVVAALGDAGAQVLSWRDLNAVLLQTMNSALGYYIIMDIIVMLVVAVIIANTLLMAVFERIREVGILGALGMRRGQIMVMFLIEAAVLGLAGIAAGVVLGSAGVAYLSKVGIFLGNMGSAASGMALGTTMYARFDLPTFASLAFWTLVIILAASLYPAWFAARREPVDALRAL
jgi:ABC-type lipoprotein release transport system permease subunit